MAATWPPDPIQRSRAHPLMLHTASHCTAAGGFPSHHSWWLSASRHHGELAPVFTEGGIRWMCQVRHSKGPWLWGGSSGNPGLLALGQETLNFGLLGQDACPLPRRCGLGAMCRARVPGCVSASAAKTVLRVPTFVDSTVVSEVYPCGASSKKPACQCRRHKRWGFDAWVGKISWRRKWQPTPVFLSGESHGQRSLAS